MMLRIADDCEELAKAHRTPRQTNAPVTKRTRGRSAIRTVRTWHRQTISAGRRSRGTLRLQFHEASDRGRILLGLILVVGRQDPTCSGPCYQHGAVHLDSGGAVDRFIDSD
jgi:hypothetical protein